MVSLYRITGGRAHVQQGPTDARCTRACLALPGRGAAQSQAVKGSVQIWMPVERCPGVDDEVEE